VPAPPLLLLLLLLLIVVVVGLARPCGVCECEPF
jgi:hypothetical protein